MKIEITRRRIIFLILPVIAIALAVAIYPYIPWPIYSLDYYGTNIGFRVNLRDAKNVPVYPNEADVRSQIMNQWIENVTIVFKPGTEQANAHYAVEVYEIVNKIAVAFSINFGYMPNFNVINVTSYEGLKGKNYNPVIALVHPMYSNETSVRLDDYVIFISGKNSTDLKEQLRNFDLAVEKFLMVALDTNLNN
jgi:hypothetical protein